MNKTISLDKKAIKKALLKRPICRFEIITKKKSKNYSDVPKKIILDVAHNAIGFEEARATILS